MKTYQLNKNQSSFGGKIVYAAIGMCMGIISISSNANQIKETVEKSQSAFVDTFHISQENSSINFINDEFKSNGSYNQVVLKIQHSFQANANLKTKMLSSIKRIKLLKDGWNGDIAKQATEASILDANKFIRNLPSSIIYEPIIRLATDGEINFFWKLDNLTLDLGLYGDGNYSYYGITNDKREFFGDEKHISNFNEETELLELLS